MDTPSQHGAPGSAPPREIPPPESDGV